MTPTGGKRKLLQLLNSDSLPHGQEHRGGPAAPSVAEAKGERLRRTGGVVLAKIGLEKLFEQINRTGVDAEKSQRPPIRRKEVDRDS